MSDIEDGYLYTKESLKLAMLFSSMSWPGISISDGAFDILRQVAEYRARAPWSRSHE